MELVLAKQKSLKANLPFLTRDQPQVTRLLCHNSCANNSKHFKPTQSNQSTIGSVGTIEVRQNYLQAAQKAAVAPNVSKLRALNSITATPPSDKRPYIQSSREFGKPFKVMSKNYLTCTGYYRQSSSCSHPKKWSTILNNKAWNVMWRLETKPTLSTMIQQTSTNSLSILAAHFVYYMCV